MSVDRDTLVAYALGALTDAEERQVVEHLQAHSSDAAFVRDLFESLADVALSQAPDEVPATSAEALLARVRSLEAVGSDAVGSNAVDAASRPQAVGLGDGQADVPSTERIAPGASRTRSRPPPGRSSRAPRSRRRQPPAARWIGLAAVATLLVVAIALLRPFDSNARIEARLERTCAVTGTLCDALVGADDHLLGTLARRVDGTSLVVLKGAPPVERVYQAWEIVAGEPRSLGVFDTRVLELDAPLSPGGVFAVTVEPPGGSPLPTTQPILTKEI